MCDLIKRMQWLRPPNVWSALGRIFGVVVCGFWLLMGIGSARGEDRAVEAAEKAISSPLLEAGIDGAHGVLLSVSGGSDLGLFEINEAARLVADAAHPDANIIFGAVIDDTLGDEVRVTVIAAGFDGGEPPSKKSGGQTARLRDGDTGEVPAVVAPGSRPLSQPRTIVFDDSDDDLDIPDFLK